MPQFDATITISAQRLEAAGLAGRYEDAEVAVRQAVERIEGAAWIDVMATAIPIPPRYPISVVYPRGCCQRYGDSRATSAGRERHPLQRFEVF
jgi:hypothetical protein